MFNMNELDMMISERKAQLKRVDRTAWRYNKNKQNPSRVVSRRKSKKLETSIECMGA